ncbi:glycosyltransferase family 4 protein [Synechococcus sp. Cruz-9H2]|uniref:glycosyltransferase family 4 protein n=1 Tax=unclassified Synechococcus TaxID=2626047 RepID=UPI0020CF7878|nr:MULTISPECIES: glycosyltransferase family 4 protein [unclassified Synechococcus]MCP9820984.1 glycosyltransferase family 4 protein [Synechococcus sp. Cruz-9H2]MCP9845228.1 glycosyltransferase family 4 protein [Synechococcus sp. Edmonson 11F2]MCP9857399.1 glycosyltransferase family 4 protein [Synechococcus sp. Cruz-9C9]MCP9864644.1 glycosyltransferase family 4 protein [Synechococcus sp. Cruz-7E5]MCP9871905.1 glycosyltransferase family 4 protein [Synechococcus sp. Cruz-7B9]
MSSLRILFAGHSLARPAGGGELSASTLLSALAKDHDVEALCVGPRADTYTTHDGVRCRDVAVGWRSPPRGIPFHLAAAWVEARFRPHLARHVAVNPPDLLLAQQPAWLAPLDVPAATRVVVFLRSPLCWGLGEGNPSRWKRALSRPFGWVRLRRDRSFLKAADLVIANSNFLRRQHPFLTQLDAEMVPPFIEPPARDAALSGQAHDCVTFVGLDRWKGAATSLQVAKAFPERPFLFLEGARPAAGWIARARRLANVTCLGWTTDMEAVFARTRLLLMPSLWDEPFGRLPVEAGFRGIPTVASRRGGLPESVGEGGLLVDPETGPAHWIEAVKALDDPLYYEALSARARRHAEGFRREETVVLFRRLVRERLQLEI